MTTMTAAASASAPFSLPSAVAFTSAMEAYWKGTLGNVPNDALREVWMAMGKAFNQQVRTYGSRSQRGEGTPEGLPPQAGEGNRWRIIKPCCGTGKSRGAMLYASMLQEGPDHPGVLLIVRQIRQADQAAEVINGLAGCTGEGKAVAVATHSQHRVPAEVLWEAPVVVISHAAFERGLQDIGNGVEGRWDSFTNWRNGPRRLTIIDESLSVTEDARVTLDDLNHLQRCIDWKLRERFPVQAAVVDTMEATLTDLARRSEGMKVTGRQLWDAKGRFNDCTPLAPLAEALAGLRLDRKLLRRSNPTENQRLIGRVTETLRALEKMRSGWSTFSKRFDEPAYHTAWSILPEGIGGAVILDATASSDRVYDLMRGKAEVVQTKGQPRDYGRVTLHVSRGHKVGKVSMEANAKEEAKDLVRVLNNSITDRASKKVLIITHLGVEPHLTGLTTDFQAFEVAHWGALDGLNDYQDFDTVVVHGLPYRDPLWSANVFFAHQGPQPPEWMDKDGDRSFAGYRDIRKAIEVGNLIVQLVQGVNRIRMRRVNDNDGGCLPCDVYLSLPSGNDSMAEEVLQGVIGELNNVKVVDWVEQATKEAAAKKPLRSNHGAAIVAWMRAAEPGRYAATTVKRELDIGKATWMRQVAAMVDMTSALHNQLSELGVHYRVEGKAGVKRAYLMKEG